MRVLWFSNCELAATTSKGSGSWLYAMSGLLASDIELYNITEADVSEIIYNEYNGIKEYVLPLFRLRNGIPSIENIEKICQIIDEVSPDLIHIWGIEKYWALLFARGYVKKNPILEIQGLLSACSDVYWAGLTPWEIIKTIGLKEFLKPSSSLCFRKRKVEARAKFENEALSKLRVFSTQSQWTRDQISFINHNAQLYETKRPVRREFLTFDKWLKPSNNNLIVFTSLSYYEPFKGMHILLKAIRELKKKYADITLKVAGPDITKLSIIRTGGYEKLLLSFISKYDLKDNVVFLGRLNAEELVGELKNSNVFVNPSFVESFSASTAEALCLGVPTVISYAGAMPEFTEELQTALCYSPMDYKSCAAKIESLFTDSELSRRLSCNSIELLRRKCLDEYVQKVQLSIYEDFLGNQLTE